jgi:tRNA(fMet)-specific endonuclease VapC
VTHLLDTNVVSYYLRGVEATVRHLQARRPETVAISAITAMDLAYGVEKRKSATLAKAVAGFIAGVQVLPFTAEAAGQAGKIRAILERRGMVLSLADSQIAGHAVALGLTLVSADAAFRRVTGLKVIDWSK